MCRFLLVAGLLLLSACDATSRVPSSRATILRHDAATVHASTKPTTQRAEWAAFEYRTFLDGRGGKLPFRILYPAHYDRTLKYPMVLFLHGSGERGSDNERQLIHGSDLFLKTRSTFPAIVVIPQCPSEKWWAAKPARFDQKPLPSVENAEPYPDLTAEPREETRMLRDLVMNVQAEESVDVSRTYVMGLSMGGMGTFEMIERYPELFAAAVPMCGGGPVSATRRYKREVALWITHGDSDDVVPVRWSRDVVQALTVQECPPRYTEFAGVKHNAWGPTLAMPDLLPWLFTQKKIDHREHR